MTIEVAVVIPAMQRPDAVAPFMSSLRSSCETATAYFVCDEPDVEEQAAVTAAGAVVLINPSALTTFAVKANHGYRATTEPWILLVGDDVRFVAGWFEAGLAAAGDHFHLVGTNDLSGLDDRELAVHPLIRRRWIDERGASWDGPGTLAHEGYRHCFVDNEWTAVARQEGVLTFASDAIVEHLHPGLGKAEPDEIYARGRRAFQRDERIWLERSATFDRGPVGSG